MYCPFQKKKKTFSGVFSVDDRGKRIKYAFLNENALVWTGGKVRKSYFIGEINLLSFLQNENGDF